MSKQIYYGQEAKAKIKEGIDAVANAVKSTLGPRGQNVLLQDGWDDNRVTKDGVTVARNIVLTDKVANAGASVIKKVANKVASEAGDGTTTSTVIAQSIIEKGSKLIAAGVNPISMKYGLDEAAKDAIKYLEEKSIREDINSSLLDIATISANGDENIGQLVADVINEVGEDGVVNIQTSNTPETYIEKVKGLRFDRGYISQYFITDPEKLICELEDPYILITDQSISTVAQLQSVMELCAMEQHPLMIIADNVEGEALVALIINNGRGTLRSCVVKAPNFGDKKLQELEDIAIVTGGKVISSQLDMKLNKVTKDQLGRCKNITITSKNCTIVKGKGSEDSIKGRISELEARLNADDANDYQKKELKDRIGRLIGGVAILYVGALSEMELNEKKDRVDDALCACRATFEKGYLPGGGISYLNAALELDKKVHNTKDTDRIAGYKLLIDALKSPLEQIVNNGFGNSQGAFVVSKVSNDKLNDDTRFNYGYDARNEEYVDMIYSGIIDPTKVAITSIKYASSIAGIYLTTGCIVIDENEKEDKK